MKKMRNISEIKDNAPPARSRNVENLKVILTKAELLTAKDIGGYQSPESFRTILLFGLVSSDEDEHEARRDENSELHDVAATTEQPADISFHVRESKVKSKQK